MNEVKLIYFEGCPEAKNVRAALLNAGVYDFEVIKQDSLSPDHELRKLSSPSVMKGNELIYGIKTNGEISSCTFDSVNFVDESQLVQRFKELRIISISKPKKNISSVIGAGFSAMLVLKCPACIPGAVAFLSALGLGFMITPTVLKSVLVLMLLITLGGLMYSYSKSHQIIYPLILGILFSAGLYVSRFYYFGWGNQVITYIAIAGLIITSLWDMKLKLRNKCPACV